MHWLGLNQDNSYEYLFRWKKNLNGFEFLTFLMEAVHVIFSYISAITHEPLFLKSD